MKISVILAFLLSWSFVSSNPRQETSNDKSVGELNHENDGGSDSSNLARTELSDDASSGKDWGGDTLIFSSQTDLDSTDETDNADDKPFLLTIIPEGSKIRAEFVHEIVGGIKKKIGTPILKNESSDIPSNDEDLSDNNHNENILWTRENTETLGKRFANRNREAEKSTSVVEETEKHGNRAKRNLGISSFLWSSPHKKSISEQLLKLSEGTTSNVLRSKKATVAEALNGHAIRKILERARASAAKVVPHKDLYNSNDFDKWLLSGSTFDMNIFRHPHHRPASADAKVEEYSDTENTDDLNDRTFSTLHNHVLDPTNRHHHHHRRRHHLRHREGKHAFGILSDPTAADNVDTEDSYAKLLHKSKHRERLSPKLQITSEEKRSRDETDGVFPKPTTVSRQAHRSLSYEDDTTDESGLQYYSRAYAPHMRFRATEDDDAENGMPRWKHAKWIHRFGARAPHSADSPELDSSEKMDDYDKRYIFKSTFEGFGDEETDDEAAEHREGHQIPSGMDIYGRINRDDLDDEETKLTTSNLHGKTNWEDILGRKRYYYGIRDQEDSVYDGEADAVAFGGTKNRHLTDPVIERTSSVNSRREKNIRSKNKHLDYDGVERSAIYSTTSAKTTGEATAERSGNVLTMKISTGTPTARKAVDIDMEHYHSRDRNAAANTATSLSSGLSDEKGSERTNNALTSPSVDDGSAAARREATKSGGQSGVLRRTRPVIDNDATAEEIEMGFSGIKSHSRVDLPWTHSSLSRERSKTHLGNQGAHRRISGYGHAVSNTIASTETEQSMDSGEDLSLRRVKTQKNWPADEYKNYADYDLGEDKEANGESSAEATSSAGSEHRYDLLRTASSSDDSREEDQAEVRRKYMDLGGGRRTGRRGTSIEMIDFPDRNDEAYMLIPEFPVYKFRKGHWPYDGNYYHNLNREKIGDDQEIQEPTRDSKKDEIDYDDWGREETFSDDDETSEKSIMNASTARRFNGQYRQHSEHAQRNRYDLYAFKQFLRNLTWSSSIMSKISEYESWERYIAYLYYLWKQMGGKSDASFEVSTLATGESREQDNAMDEEISLDRHGRKHTTDEDNYIHLRKRKKWPQRAGKFMIKNIPGLEEDKIKLIKISNGKTSNEDYGEEEDKEISEENITNQRGNHELFTRTGNMIRENPNENYGEEEEINGEDITNQRGNHELYTRTGNMIREDSTTDIMSKARSSKRKIDNNRYHQQGLWNSLLSKNSYADARKKTNGYDSHRRNKNVDINQAADSTESADSESNLRRVSTKTSSTSRSHAESQMDEHTFNKSNDFEKIMTQTLGKEVGYQADSYDTSVTSSKSIDKSQVKRMHHSRKKSKINKKNSANTETLTKTASLSGATDKSQSNVRNMIDAKLFAESQNSSEHYLENLEDNRKYSTNAGASANAISMKNKRKSMSENASPFSKLSETEIENYSNEDTSNVQMSATNSEASSASSSKSFTKSHAKTEQTRKNFRDIQMNAKASSTATDNMRNEWLTSSSRLSAESRLKSDYYSTNPKDSQINAISRSSADTTLSDTVENERQSHLQRFSSTSSEKLQAESQHDSNSIQNSQMNIATTESSMASASSSNAESRHRYDLSKLLEKEHNLNDVIEMQGSNIKNRSKLKSALSSKLHAKLKLKDEHYLSVKEDNENNVVNTGASKTKSSSDVKDDHQQESTSSSSASRSFAKSQVENRNSRKETSMSNTISSDVVNGMEQRNLLRVLSSSQTASKGKVQKNPRTINKSMIKTLTEINDDKRRREDDTSHVTWFIDPKNNLETSTNNEVISKRKTAKENSDNALNAATSATAMTFTDIKNTQKSITTSSSIDSKAKTRVYSENQLKEGEAITENSAVSRISATSGTSSEIGDNDKNKLLKTSSLSELHSTLAEEKRRDMDTAQNSQESMAAATASSESTVSSKNVRSRNKSAKESTLLAFSEQARQKQRNLSIRRGKSEDIAGEVTLMTTSNKVYNQDQDSLSKGASSVVSYKELQTDDKLRDKNEASARNSVEISKSAIIRKNEHERLKHVSSYDYRDGERVRNEINSRGSIKYPKRTGDTNEMISTGSVTSTSIGNVSSNTNRNNLLKVISSDNLHAESSREDEDKSDIHSDTNGTANTRNTFYDDKQARENILRKSTFLSNLNDETRMHKGKYDIRKKLKNVNDNKEFKEHNLWNVLSNRLRVRNENAESTANTNENVKYATDPSILTNTAKGDCQDDPVVISIANAQDENQLESTSSIDTKAQSEINQESSASRKDEIINTRDMYNINKWRTKYQTTASSSSHAETQDKSENTLKTKALTESITSEIDENSHKSGSVREESLSVSSGFHNYGDHQRGNIGNTAKVKAPAETSISNVSPIECQDDAEKEPISQLKRHDLNVRNGDKEIASDVLQSAEETKFNGMQNTQQRKLSGSITSSNSRTEVQHEEIGDFAKEGLEVTASAATSAQTALSSETVESEFREKLIGVSSGSDSYTKSQRGSKHSLNAASRGEQIIANAKASADSAVSSNLESMRQSDWAKNDSLVDLSRKTHAKIENKDVLESSLANIADATSSTKETSRGVIKDERQSAVTTTALLSNSRAEAQKQHDCSSSVQRESIGRSSNDTKDRALKTENIVNSIETNFKAGANTMTSADALLSSGVQDAAETLSSVNSYAESRTDNTRTQTMTSNGFRNVEVNKSLQTTLSDAYANAQATSENTNSIEKDSSAVVNARTETATSDIKGTRGLFDLLNAAGNSKKTMNAKGSATSLASVDAREKDTVNLMGEKSNVDPRIRGMTKAENDDNILQKDLHNRGNAEAAAQATNFSDVKNKLQERDEHESRILQEQRLITVDSTASSTSKTFDHADSVQRTNLEKLTASSNSYERSDLGSENRVNTLAKDVFDASGSTKTMTSNGFRSVEEDKSLRTTSSSDANAQAIDENTSGARKDSSAVANARTEAATSAGIKGTNSHSLLDLLTGAATRMRAEGEAISREGAIKEDLSETSSGVFSGAGVESTRILGDNYESSTTVNAIAETGSGDQRDRQGDSRGTASSSSGIRDNQFDVMKSTSSANSHAEAQIASEGVAEEDPGVNISTLEPAEAHSQLGGADPSGWLVTTSDAGTVAERRAQNKDKFNVSRGVEEVAVYAGASAGAVDGNIEGEQRDTRAEGEYQDGSNVATKIRHAGAASSASVATIKSMGMEDRSVSKSGSSNKMTVSSSNEANAETRMRTEGRSSVLRNSESSVNMEEMRSSTASSAASSVSASTFDDLGMRHRARYHKIGNGMWAIVPTSKEIRLSSGETTLLYPSREISKCDENVETREFISEATSLYQMLNKQRGSEILLMKKNPKGPVQIVSLKNSVPPLITYRLIPREVYERIREIIASKQIIGADCAPSST